MDLIIGKNWPPNKEEADELNSKDEEVQEKPEEQMEEGINWLAIVDEDVKKREEEEEEEEKKLAAADDDQEEKDSKGI